MLSRGNLLAMTARLSHRLSSHVSRLILISLSHAQVEYGSIHVTTLPRVSGVVRRTEHLDRSPSVRPAFTQLESQHLFTSQHSLDARLGDWAFVEPLDSLRLRQTKRESGRFRARISGRAVASIYSCKSGRSTFVSERCISVGSNGRSRSAPAPGAPSRIMARR